MEYRLNETDRGKPKVLGGKSCPSATLSTTNPTWTDPGSNPGLRGERPATNRLSHGTASEDLLELACANANKKQMLLRKSYLSQESFCYL
jgi:hypothetical protein